MRSIFGNIIRSRVMRIGFRSPQSGASQQFQALSPNSHQVITSDLISCSAALNFHADDLCIVRCYR